jgi:hypothetical protein
MRALGPKDATRGKTRKTRFPDLPVSHPLGPVNRQFALRAARRLFVAGSTRVHTWSGFALTAFALGAYPRVILDW